MERINDNDYVKVYSDYDYKIYMPSSNSLDGGYILEGKINSEPYYVEVLWKDVVKVNQMSNAFKHRQVRFEENVEELALKQLRIDINRDKNSYTRDDIERIVKNPTDTDIKNITLIDDLEVIETFISQLVYLKNTNKFFVSDKLELYLRARKEELQEGIRKTELEVDETEKTIETAVVESEIDEEKPKKSRPAKTK
ncbi:hypothetical protein [Clostridium sp. ZBS18]|uniref:hypothetical protein n=1 Tax=Clostridium sp. ZBS18 TaxID=2949967 RepID=UPI00207AAD58|nr:hypothetical protein [Clostridium sp. ZBS18]